MNTQKDHDVLKAMTEFGGSFVKALAEAAYRADSENYRKLKEAFPEYWDAYRKTKPTQP